MPGVISALYCRLCYCALTHPPSLPLSTKHTLCLSVRATSFLVLRYFPVFSHLVPLSFSFIFFFLFFRPFHPLLFTSVCPSPTVVFEDKQWRFRRCINVSKRKKERTGEWRREMEIKNKRPRDRDDGEREEQRQRGASRKLERNEEEEKGGSVVCLLSL